MDANATALEIDAKLLERLKELEKSAVLAAEENQLEKSIQYLDECLQLAPTYASAYNNR